MTIIHVTEATVGAPNSGRISGTAGDLYAMLKYALPLNGWAVEYDDTVNFNAVFRPATGNRFRLTIQDNAATSGSALRATVRGAENASSATSYTDPFPTVAVVTNANSNWVKSDTASTTARNFDLFVGETWVIYIVNLTGGTNIWEFHMFGDAVPALSGDSYATFCTVRGGTAASAQCYALGLNGTSVFPNRAYWARTYDGTVKSPQAAMQYLSGSSLSSLGSYNSCPAALAGPTTGIDRQKIVMADAGVTTSTPSSTLALQARAWAPNLWNPQHGGRGTVNSRDTFTDTAYNASAQFMAATATNGATAPFVVIETTDTWTAP